MGQDDMRIADRPDVAPLAGLALAELGGDVATRYCGRLFARLGASVVRVGRPAEGRTEAEAAFDAWLDEGKPAADDFAAACRQLPGAPQAILAGQTPEAVRQAEALAVAAESAPLTLSMTWFGPDGPYSGWVGDDALVQALIGAANGFGPAEGPPTLPQGHAPQIVAGATLFIAGVAALLRRRTGGKVSRVEADVLEAALCFSETIPPSLERSGGRSARLGVNRFAANHPSGIYRTLDGWVGVTALTPAQWRALADLIGRPEWADDPRFATSPARVANAAPLDEGLSAAFLTRPTLYWVEAGQAARIPMAPVPQTQDLLETPHWRSRRSFAPFAAGGDLVAPGLPFRVELDGVRRPVPQGDDEAPLSGVRVIDFSMGWAGPLCTRHLADLGADVVKIEAPTHYDWWRGWEPPGASDPPEYELKPVFNIMNRNKRGVTLDLATEEGRTTARALVADADLVVENFAPGVMDKLGLGRDVLQQVRPGLVMVSMGAFGATGPWRHFRAYGSTVEQASGIPHLNGHDHWPPAMQHGAYGDPVAGLYGAVAALALLYGRDRLGGAWVDLAQVECLFQLSADAILAAQLEGPPARLGSRHPAISPRCVVATAKAQAPIAVAVTTPAQWAGLCDVLGRPDWAGDPRLRDARGRRAMSDAVEAELAAWAKGQEPASAAARLQAAGVPAAPVVAGHDLSSDPHALARGSWTSVERRHVGRHILAAAPYRLDGARPPIRRPAPLLGEHTAEVLEALGAALPGQP